MCPCRCRSRSQRRRGQPHGDGVETAIGNVEGEELAALDILEGNRGQSLDTRAFGVPSERLREWVSLWDEKSFALRFRGLHALYVPQG